MQAARWQHSKSGRFFSRATRVTGLCYGNFVCLSVWQSVAHSYPKTVNTKHSIKLYQLSIIPVFHSKYDGEIQMGDHHPQWNPGIEESSIAYTYEINYNE